ncbi:MAG: radical SAM protein [Candidatus Bathyarchaeota archaeon]
MKRNCPAHGPSKSLYWDDAEHFKWGNQFGKPRKLKSAQTSIEKGCPYDCGLCPNHQQHTCLAVMEVTKRCNLTCNYCFASSPSPSQDVNIESVRDMFKTLHTSEGQASPTQLSGGEPTLRKDLVELLELGTHMGFHQLVVDTNGIKLSKNQKFGARPEKGRYV